MNIKRDISLSSQNTLFFLSGTPWKFWYHCPSKFPSILISCPKFVPHISGVGEVTFESNLVTSYWPQILRERLVAICPLCFSKQSIETMPLLKFRCYHVQRAALHSTVSTQEEWRHLLVFCWIRGLCQAVRRSILLDSDAVGQFHFIDLANSDARFNKYMYPECVLISAMDESKPDSG